MAVKIRLRRMGTNKAPFFRVVVADVRQPIKGRFIETIGWYDPKKAGMNHEIKLDRIEYWVDQGAQLSDTVKSLVKQSRTGTPARKKSVPAETSAPAPAAAPPEAVEDALVAEEPAPDAEETVAEQAPVIAESAPESDTPAAPTKSES